MNGDVNGDASGDVNGRAPFRAGLAAGPEPGAGAAPPGGRAVWLHASDGVRLRAGLWPGGGRGTVVVLTGRSEYAEKYGPTAGVLAAGGWSTLGIDWRGQGFSDRLLPDPMIGHVGSFSEYQRDLDAVMGWLAREGPAAGLHPPLVMLAHSMGGAIGLRALLRGLPFAHAIFSAPMWGLSLPFWQARAAGLLSRLPCSLSQDHAYAPGTGPGAYVLDAPFAGNLLTSSHEGWDWLALQAREEPAFRLGGPSLGWLRAALREMRALRRAPAPRVPALITLGTEENVVSPAAIRRRAASWRGGRLLTCSSGRHEILMERPELRDAFLAEMRTFLAG